MGARAFGRFVANRLAPAPTGSLSGTTKVAGSPDTAVRRLVQLFISNNAFGAALPVVDVVRWQWSDASGNWQFSNLDPALRYGVIAYDHTGTYDPVVKLNLIPTP